MAEGANPIVREEVGDGARESYMILYSSFLSLVVIHLASISYKSLTLRVKDLSF